jgi:FAD:protein FMN transferase
MIKTKKLCYPEKGLVLKKAEIKRDIYLMKDIILGRFKIFIKLYLALIGIYLTISTNTLAQYQKHTFTRPKMGSPFVITLYAQDTIGLYQTIEAAYTEVDKLNTIFSDYSETSDISLLTKKAKKDMPIGVSKELMHVLKLSDEAARLSRGAFDITVGNIVKLWRKARKDKAFPNELDMKLALEKTGFKQITYLSDTTIAFDREGVRLDFGGIVKGYAAQKVVDILSKNNFPMCLVDAGGDLAIGEKPLRTFGGKNTEGGWQVAISVPQSETALIPQMLSLQKCAVATSGDMYNFVDINGKRYSHIVNPKTGIGLTHQRNVTVVAKDGATADWLATACSVLPIRRAKRLIKKIPDAELLILEMHNGTIKSYQSKGFARYFEEH